MIEVLSAYVRQHTNPTQRRQRPPPVAVHKAPSRPAVDTQAAVSVLGRLPSRPGPPRGNLTSTHLAGTQLIGANLATAKNLTQQQLGSARGNEDTKLPAGLQWPAHWLADPTAPSATDL